MAKLPRPVTVSPLSPSAEVFSEDKPTIVTLLIALGASSIRDATKQTHASPTQLKHSRPTINNVSSSPGRREEMSVLAVTAVFLPSTRSPLFVYSLAIVRRAAHWSVGRKRRKKWSKCSGGAS